MARKKAFFTLMLGGPQRIRRIRGKLSQAEFGKIIGLTQGTIHKYEKDIIFPDE
jgi:transcriptional regulator with XRE-family HTH domain